VLLLFTPRVAVATNEGGGLLGAGRHAVAELDWEHAANSGLESGLESGGWAAEHVGSYDVVLAGKFTRIAAPAVSLSKSLFT